MIKDPKRYREQSERERIRSLQRLTYRQSAKLVEALMASRLIYELRMRDDDRPRALARQFHGHS